jgi:hypothetical protein
VNQAAGVASRCRSEKDVVVIAFALPSIGVLDLGWGRLGSCGLVEADVAAAAAVAISLPE